MNIEIKEFEAHQLEFLTQLSRQTFTETFAEHTSAEDLNLFLSDHLTFDLLSTEIANPNSRFYFVLTDGIIAGYMKLNVGDAQSEMGDKEALEVERIYILKEFLGQRLGQVLIDKAFADGREMSKTYVWLGVWEYNMRALAFYKKNGFEVFDQHAFPVGNDPQIDLMMRRLL